MKPYIDFNTQKRIEATNEADKQTYICWISAIRKK